MRYQLNKSCYQVPQFIEKVEINVFTEDNVKQAPDIDHNSMNDDMDNGIGNQSVN